MNNEFMAVVVSLSISLSIYALIRVFSYYHSSTSTTNKVKTDER